MLFEGWTGQDFSKLIGSDKKRAAAGKLVVSTCQARALGLCDGPHAVQKHGFDGVVFEILSQVGGDPKVVRCVALAVPCHAVLCCAVLCCSSFVHMW
jgi:hypothetical protein